TRLRGHPPARLDRGGRGPPPFPTGRGGGDGRPMTTRPRRGRGDPEPRSRRSRRMSQTTTEPTDPTPAGGQSALAPAPTSNAQGDPMEALVAFLRDLLAEQCRQTGAVGAVAFLSAGKARQGGQVATWLDEAAPSHVAKALSSQGPTLTRLGRLAAAAAGGAGGGGARSEAISIPQEGLYATAPPHRALAAPLIADGRAEGACVALAPLRGELDDSEALVRMSLLAARFETFLWRQQCLTEAEQKARLREA